MDDVALAEISGRFGEIRRITKEMPRRNFPKDPDMS